MKEIPLEEYKNVLLEILVDVDRFCKNNNIRYFLLGGTLLGAVRHEGFIPWDDDIDICMLREDYDKFIREYQSEMERYSVLSLNNNPNYYLVAAKVIDTKTYLLENVSHAFPIGAYIDVFPIDYCPDDYNMACSYADKFKLYRSLLNIKNIRISSSRKIHKNIALILGKLIGFPVSRKKLVDYISRHISALVEKRPTQYVAEMALMPYGHREIYEYEWFRESVQLKFEGHLFPAPKGYEEILKKNFGDYMQLPPEEKRVTHHDFEVYWREDE